MTFTRRSLLASGLSVPFLNLLGSGQGAADIATDEIKAVYAPAGHALNGYDPVTYFVEGGPRPGSDSHRIRWRGAVWRFASEANRLAFEMNPSAYAPQFGGYCAYTVANGYPMKSEPDVWTIHEGRLYLNFNASIQVLWQRDMAHYIASAEENWRRFDKS